MWTKVLSKDEWMKLLLSMPRRGVVDYVVVTNRVRLLARPIVACGSHLMRCAMVGRAWSDGGWFTLRRA